MKFDVLVKAMQADARQFAKDMSKKGVEQFHDEMVGIWDENPKFTPVGAWILRSTKYGETEPYRDTCPVLQEQSQLGSGFASRRHQGLSLAANLRFTARERANTEPRHIAINTLGEIALVIDHIHGSSQCRRRVTKDKLPPEYFLSPALKLGNGAGREDAFRQWRADLFAVASRHKRQLTFL